MTALLELRSAGLTGRLQPVKLRLFAGQKVVLLGRSGAGKSSLIGLCNGELSPDRGVVLWQGKALDKRTHRERRQLGTLWQDLRLVDDLTAVQNIQCGALGRHNLLWALRNLLNLVDPKPAEALMRGVDLELSLQHQPVRLLSGGQRQRVALARLLHQKPQLVLADEPLSALDPVLAEIVLQALLQRPGCLISLHRPDLVHRFDRVLGLQNGELVLDATTDQVQPEVIARLYGEQP